MELDLFRGVVPFVAVAEAGSFRGAALQLKVSPAAISKSVQVLERELGVTLFDRDSRRVVLTKAGAAFLERCRPAVAAVSSARAVVDDARKEPKGELVFSVPFVLAPLLMPALARLSHRYPALSFTVKVSDALSKLAEESVDVALRMGVLADSSLVARRLMGTRLVTIASPAYLARATELKTLAQLDDHECLGLTGPSGRPHPWLFSSGPRPVKASLMLDHGPSLVHGALAGLGVTQAFDFMVKPLLAEGKLVQVLPALAAAGPEVHAVCAPGRKATAAVRAAFDVLTEAFAELSRQ